MLSLWISDQNWRKLRDHRSQSDCLYERQVGRTGSVISFIHFEYLYVPVVMHLLYELKQDPDLAENKRWAGTIVGKANQKGLNIEDDNAGFECPKAIGYAFW